MAKANPIKIGLGAGSILLGIFSLFSNSNSSEIIFGIILIAFGISLIVWN